MTKTPRFYQAIVTRFHGATNVKGSRVKATTATGSVTLHWDHALNTDENHIEAAQTLARKFKWLGKYYMGTLPDGACVFISPDELPAFDNKEQNHT